MALINKGIIDNVEAAYIETYLRKNGLIPTEDEKGIQLADWINTLIKTNIIEINTFEEFLFNELFWGKRKLIRIYQLGDINKIKYIEDWKDSLEERYGVKKFNFNDILGTHVNRQESRKIAAIHCEENEKGEIARLQILFVCYVEISDKNGYRDSCAYIPVDIDFLQRKMVLKAWNRQGVIEQYRADTLTDSVKSIMCNLFGVITTDYKINHKKVLYSMSKGLVDNVYNKIPAFNQIDLMQKCVDDFEQSILERLPIVHIDENEDGKKKIPQGVMEFSDEIKKAIERLVVSDYFFDRSYDEIWNMGIEAIIARIKFNDSENILASLSGQDSEKPIFCSKTFMYLKKSMEDAKLVEKLWVVKKRSRGKINIRYDATNEEYLGILIKFGVRYAEEDLDVAMEIYKEYESEISRKIAIGNKRQVS